MKQPFFYHNTKPFFSLTFILFVMLQLGGCSTLPVTWDMRVAAKNLPPEINLHYKELGKENKNENDDVILLLHGFAESSFTWRYLESDLAKNHHVINLDLKGFGDSPKPKDGRYSIYDQAVAVKDFIKQHQFQHVTLVGHSLGGGVALALTLMSRNEPWEVNRLILVDAAAYQQNLPSMLRDLSTPVLGQMGVYLIPTRIQAKQAYEFSFYDDDRIPEEGVKHAAMNFAKPGSRYVFLQSAKQLIPEDIQKISKQYKRIEQPTLIIWGYNDVVVPRQFARRLHKDLRASELKFISHAGHMPHEETPRTVLRAMETFLRKTHKGNKHRNISIF